MTARKRDPHKLLRRESSRRLSHEVTTCQECQWSLGNFVEKSNHSGILNGGKDNDPSWLLIGADRMQIDIHQASMSSLGINYVEIPGLGSLLLFVCGCVCFIWTAFICLLLRLFYLNRTAVTRQQIGSSWRKPSGSRSQSRKWKSQPR